MSRDSIRLTSQPRIESSEQRRAELPECPAICRPVTITELINSNQAK